MNFDAFAKTLGAGALPPTDNPLGASNAGLMANYVKGAYLSSAAGRQVGAGTAQAQVAAQNQRAQEDYAKKLKIQELSDQAETLKNEFDPKKFTKVAKDDGGFDFFDGAGKPINVQQFAKSQGKSPKQVLSSSDNSLDLQYVAHHDLTQKLAEALVNGDKKSLDKLYEANPGLKEATKGLSGQQVLVDFKKAYPHVYGGNEPQTPLQSPAQTFGGKAPGQGFNLMNPSTYGSAAGGLFQNLLGTLGG